MRAMTAIIAYHHNSDNEPGQRHTGFTNFESVEEINKIYKQAIATGHYGVYILIGRDFIKEQDKIEGPMRECDPMGVMTLADHAEAWYKENGNVVPERDTDAWVKMYEAWVMMAFEGIGDTNMECVRCGKKFDCKECPDKCAHRDRYDECICSGCWAKEDSTSNED